MKKLILLALAVAAVTSVKAEGYQVNTLSAKQLGMAHTGVSMKLDSESTWFNPAAAAYQDQKFTIAGGVTGINAVATWTSTDGGSSQESDNGLSTPLYLNMNYKINKDLAIGLTVNTPYGSSMNWADNWAGMDQVQSINLQAYNIQPTVSYKMFNDKLSIGAGLMVSWGSFELSKSLISQSSASALEYLLGEGAGSASATLSGDAAVSVGVNVGVMYDINEKWSLGASYRSKMMMTVDSGSTALEFGGDYTRSTIESLDATGSTAALLSLMENYNFSSELPMPATFSAGVSFRPTSQWEIALEMQVVGWSAYEDLDFDYSGLYTSANSKEYENTMIYRLGAQYDATEWITVRAGFYYDQSPVQSEYFSPETPSMNKLGYTCGLSLMPCKENKSFSIDLAYAYIVPAGYDRQSTFEAFEGTYRAVANTFSLGLSWGF